MAPTSPISDTYYVNDVAERAVHISAGQSLCLLDTALSAEHPLHSYIGSNCASVLWVYPPVSH